VPRKIPPPPPKGTRHPGAGRKPGTPNKISVEVKTLVSQLVNDVAYQHRLRHDFRRRKVHPTIEALIWTYHLGKPRQTIDVNANVDIEVTQRIEEERRAFALLDVREMEELAAASQALVDRALMLSRARISGETPQDVVVEAESADDPSKSLGFMAGSDNRSSVNSAISNTSESPNPDSAASYHEGTGHIDGRDE